MFLQKELVQMQADVQIKIQETEKDLKAISLDVLQHKVSQFNFSVLVSIRPPVSI